ncbi:MAG: SpoIIE family protein phosphatase [Rhizobacter sp.]
MASFSHAAFDVNESSGVGEARRHAVRLAESFDFDEVAAGRVALVVNELGNNLVRHTSGGRLLVGGVHDGDGRVLVEVMSLDTGPGIRDIRASLVDGFSTGGTAGQGLGAVRRLSQVFDIYSRPAGGTVVLSRLSADGVAPRASADVEAGVVRIPAPGEHVCGDNWSLVPRDGRWLLLVADGLGHGPQAMEAADAAVEVLADVPDGPPSRILERMHQRMRATRGAAAALAEVDPDAGKLQYAGVGNIAGRVISGVSDRSLMSQHGTVGLQIRKVQDVAYDWPPHAVVVLHSDGFSTRWALGDAADVLQHHPALVAAWIARDQIRGRDDATLVVLKRRGG